MVFRFASAQTIFHLLLALFMTPHMSYKVSKFIKYFLWFMRSDLIESVRRQVAKVVLGVNNDLPLTFLCHLPHVPQAEVGKSQNR